MTAVDVREKKSARKTLRGGDGKVVTPHVEEARLKVISGPLIKSAFGSDNSGDD